MSCLTVFGTAFWYCAPVMDDIYDMCERGFESDAWAEYCASCDDDGEYDLDACETLDDCGMHITTQP